jgi:hypothetical protein
MSTARSVDCSTGYLRCLAAEVRDRFWDDLASGLKELIHVER